MAENDFSNPKLSPFRFKGSIPKTITPESRLEATAQKERRARAAEWKARKEASKKEARRRRTPKVLPYDKDTKETEVLTLKNNLIQAFISFSEWGEVSNTIKHYQEELTKVQKQLEDEGKKCTGCALNPYKSKFSRSLKEDFTDSDKISDQEIALIKSALKTKSLQVGVKNGQAHLR